jgi:hypothetical protein
LSFTARPYKFIPTENILFDLSGNILFYFFFLAPQNFVFVGAYLPTGWILGFYHYIIREFTDFGSLGFYPT